jgi:hypothetical protein
MLFTETIEFVCGIAIILSVFFIMLFLMYDVYDDNRKR